MATRRRPRATSRRGWRARASRSVRRGRRTTRWRTSSWSSPRRASSPPDGRSHAAHHRPGPQGAHPAAARPSRAGSGPRAARGPHGADGHHGLADGDRHPDRHPGLRSDPAVAAVRGRVSHVADLSRGDPAARHVAGDDAGQRTGARGGHHPPALRARDPPPSAGRGAGARGRHRWQHRPADPRQRRPDHARLRAAARRRDGPGHPDGDAALVQSRPRAAKVLRARVPRARPVDLPDGARRARDVARGRAEDNLTGLRLEHLGARVPARQDPGRHGDRVRAVRAARRAHVHALRPALRRRPHAGDRRQRAVRVLRDELRLARRRGHSQPGRRRAGRRAGRLPALLPALGAHLPDREHPRHAAVDLEFRPGALLHRHRARRLLAGGRLAGRVVGGAGHRRHRAGVLRARLARDASHAGEGVRQGLGRLDVGVVVPYDFARRRARGRPATVQVLLNAANANTAQIAQGYVEGAVAFLNRDLAGTRAEPVELRTALLYNPGLVNAWFIVTGVFGTLIILNGSLVSAATMIREKERGTVEQLLMTPASSLQMITAKMAPLFVLLMTMVMLVIAVARLVFGIPFRGSPALLLAACACCVLSGIGLGTFVSTFARSASQTQLISFFINPPLAMLSGGLTPIEAMPKWVQPLTFLNPIAHFATIARSVLVKGAGLDVVYPNLIALVALASLFVGISAWRFRSQLS